MKKLLLTSLLFAACYGAFAQKYMTRTGKIVFDATSSSSPEKIEAVNNQVAVIADATGGRLIFQLLVKGFKFEKELMEEHFNENYMESDKYNKADFDGTIANLSEINFKKDGSYPAKVTGKLQIHGVTKEVTEKGTITVKGSNLSLVAEFNVKLADYNISIPSLVADKVAKDAKIKLACDLVEK